MRAHDCQKTIPALGCVLLSQQMHLEPGAFSSIDSGELGPEPTLSSTPSGTSFPSAPVSSSTPQAAGGDATITNPTVLQPSPVGPQEPSQGATDAEVASKSEGSSLELTSAKPKDAALPPPPPPKGPSPQHNKPEIVHCTTSVPK